MLGSWHPDEWGRCPDEMSMQQCIQTCDLRLLRLVLLTHQAYQAQSEILADAGVCNSSYTSEGCLQEPAVGAIRRERNSKGQTINIGKNKAPVKRDM